jgi:hypothetical protein
MFPILSHFIRYRILNTVYRGHIKQSSVYLSRALKIIMHSNYVHTRDHPHRTHHPMDLDLDDLAQVEVPIHPDVGTGMTSDDFDLGDFVKVWHFGDWVRGKVTYKTRAGTFNVQSPPKVLTHPIKQC